MTRRRPWPRTWGAGWAASRSRPGPSGGRPGCGAGPGATRWGRGRRAPRGPSRRALTHRVLFAAGGRLGGFKHVATNAALSPDGKLLAASGFVVRDPEMVARFDSPSAIKVWDVSTGREVHTLNHTRHAAGL